MDDVLNDVPFEAAFLRAAALVGFIHEREVSDWAAALLHPPSSWTARLADVATARVELSATREALRPLAASAGLHRVAGSMLTAVAVEQTVHARRAVDLVNILGQIRQEFRRHLPETTAARIKTFENRSMFAQAAVPGLQAPTTSEVRSVLDEIHEPGRFELGTWNLELLVWRCDDERAHEHRTR